MDLFNWCFLVVLFVIVVTSLYDFGFLSFISKKLRYKLKYNGFKKGLSNLPSLSQNPFGLVRNRTDMLN